MVRLIKVLAGYLPRGKYTASPLLRMAIFFPRMSFFAVPMRSRVRRIKPTGTTEACILATRT
jgi:hypothetical protein